MGSARICRYEFKSTNSLSQESDHPCQNMKQASQAVSSEMKVKLYCVSVQQLRLGASGLGSARWMGKELSFTSLSAQRAPVPPLHWSLLR